MNRENTRRTHAIADTGQEWQVRTFLMNYTEETYPFKTPYGQITPDLIRAITEACNGHACKPETVYHACLHVLGKRNG